MKNKPLLLAIIYSVIYIGATLYFYFSQQLPAFKMVYVISMAAVLPFVILTIKIQRDSVYQGIISGKEAAKEGMKFVLYSALILGAFQIAFFYGGWRDFKIETIPGFYRAWVDSLSADDKVKYFEVGTQKVMARLSPAQIEKFREELIQKNIAIQIEGITVFKEFTGVFFRLFFAGLFSSFLAALFLKRK
ncbi:MAG: hypothetical protein IAF38_09740 [Bacteroidia bacterium]|nr:hypothetical protein [Bacteroidia bacterium]